MTERAPEPRGPLRVQEYERLAFLHAPNATLILADRVILRASLMVEEVFGWKPAEIEGQSIKILYPGQTDFERIGERARHAMESQPVYSDERFMRHRNGEVIWMAGQGRTLDTREPQKLAIWTYRPIENQPALPHNFTAAEMRVAKYLVNGLTSKEIAKAIGSSPRTIEVHRANMVRKLQVRNSFELVRHLLTAQVKGP